MGICYYLKLFHTKILTVFPNTNVGRDQGQIVIKMSDINGEKDDLDHVV
jgi:hypothetical protein